MGLLMNEASFCRHMPKRGFVFSLECVGKFLPFLFRFKLKDLYEDFLSPP
jgi:hypothetical protein